MTLILGIAAVAAIGVPMNALFFQDGRHPAPLFSAQRSNAITVPPTPPTPPTRPAAIEAARTERETFIQARPAPKDAIASKLEKLDAKPLEAGKTEPAKADLTRTGQDARRHRPVDSSKAPPTASADKADKTEKAASPEKTAQVDKNVLYAQRALLRLGYVVRADGVLNNATRHALEKFERDAGQPGKGKITPKVLKLLATLSGLARR